MNPEYMLKMKRDKKNVVGNGETFRAFPDQLVIKYKTHRRNAEKEQGSSLPQLYSNN